MTDIDVCTGKGCPLAKTCYRHLNYTGQRYAMTPERTDGKCVMYKQKEFYGQ